MKLYQYTAFLTGICLLFSGCGKSEQEQEIRVYSSFFPAQSNAIAEDNEIQQIIAQKIGAKCIETWIDQPDEEDKIFSNMIISNQYPDFVYPSSSNLQKLIRAEAVIPIDSYWDDYPNVRNYFTDEEWDRIRSEDGHIYYIPSFSTCYMQDTNTFHNDEAFWVQVKVLEWAGYPEIVTLDDYFHLLESYVSANPTDENGEPYIAYEIQANDTYFFSLDNPPMFLDGYPNDGCCIVNTQTLEAEDYNLSPTAKKWFRKLNEEYHKGIIDSSCFVMDSEEYYEKLETGRVLGMVDQSWNFSRATGNLPPECTYIPLGVTIESGIEEHYHSRTAFNASSGIAITTSCEDPVGALQFLNDLLSPEILTLRFWGIEETDYLVDENGVFYHTDEQAVRWRDKDYAKQHICLYSYFPYYWGMNQDGINAYCPSYQPEEFYKRLNDDVKRCFDAYGVKTYVELLNEAPENPPWFPMWSYSDSLAENSPARTVAEQIENTKHNFLPMLVMTDDFDAAWDAYQTAYAEINSQVYFDELTSEIRRRSQ